MKPATMTADQTLIIQHVPETDPPEFRVVRVRSGDHKAGDPAVVTSPESASNVDTISSTDTICTSANSSAMVAVTVTVSCSPWPKKSLTANVIS